MSRWFHVVSVQYAAAPLETVLFEKTSGVAPPERAFFVKTSGVNFYIFPVKLYQKPRRLKIFEEFRGIMTKLDMDMPHSKSQISSKRVGLPHAKSLFCKNEWGKVPLTFFKL